MGAGDVRGRRHGRRRRRPERGIGARWLGAEWVDGYLSGSCSRSRQSLWWKKRRWASRSGAHRRRGRRSEPRKNSTCASHLGHPVPIPSTGSLGVRTAVLEPPRRATTRSARRTLRRPGAPPLGPPRPLLSLIHGEWPGRQHCKNARLTDLYRALRGLSS